MTLPSRNRTKVCGATIRCVAITPRGALHRLRLLPFILSSSRGNRGIEPRPWEAQSQMLPLHQLPRSSSCRSSCRELPLPELNRGRPRDNRPCYPYTKGDRTPSYSSVAVHLVVDPPPTGTRPQGAFVLSCDPFGTHWIAVRFLSRNGGGIYK